MSDGTATCSGTATVQTALTAGVMTAQTPGATSLFASVSGVNSAGSAYTTCPVTSILVHSSGGSGTTFSLTPPGTQGLTADVLDSAGQAIQPTLSWGSSSTAAATVAATGSSNGATVTSVNGGTAYITASCAYPTCNINLPAQYSQNVATVAVTGNTVTTVYVGSSKSKTLVPVSTGNNTVGTAITLPDYPNSIVADPGGAGVYLGTASGLLAIPTGATSPTTSSSVKGTILAISPDGKYLLVSDDVNNVVQYFSIATGTLVNSKSAITANASAYTPDSLFNEWVNATQLGVGYQTGFLNAFTLSPAPTDLDISAQGGLTYISSATGAQILAYSTCDTAQEQLLSATSPTLIKALPNGSGAVAVDPPSIDVVSTPSTLNAGCPVTTLSTINGYDLGAGSFTPAQLLVSANSSSAFILSNLSSVITFNLANLAPSTIPLAGGAVPLYGGLTIDGKQLWVGASDNNVHRVNTSPPQDVIQVAVNLKDANGNVTPPNLVSVVP